MTTGRSTSLVVVVLFVLAAVPRLAHAQKLSDAELKRLGTATVTTAAEHRKLAAHYRAHAAEHEADAKLHDEIVTAARKLDQTTGHAWELARGADHYAEHSRESAEALRELAAVHEGIAEVMSKAKESR